MPSPPERPTFSRLVGAWRMGADYFHRSQLALETPEVSGVVDRLEDLAHPGFSAESCARVHAGVRAFFERTADLDLFIESHWHPVMRPLWWLIRPVMGRIGQLFFPWDTARIRTRVFALDRARDGRSDARGVVRTYEPDGRAMQVFAYATLLWNGVRFMSAAIPLPWGNLAGLLRLDGDSAGHGEITAVSLTSRPDRNGKNPGGIWFATKWFALPLPFTETLRFWAVGSADVPTEILPPRVDHCSVMAIHEQRLFGVPVAVHRYWFTPRR